LRIPEHTIGARLRCRERAADSGLHRSRGTQAYRLSALFVLLVGNPMRTLICGSIAYDNIMVFRGRFREHILPEQIHILNVAFLVLELRREFVGCAVNIDYNLKLLSFDPLFMATIGYDSLL